MRLCCFKDSEVMSLDCLVSVFAPEKMLRLHLNDASCLNPPKPASPMLMSSTLMECDSTASTLHIICDDWFISNMLRRTWVLHASGYNFQHHLTKVFSSTRSLCRQILAEMFSIYNIAPPFKE